LCDIFNADESGFYFRSTANKSFVYENESCNGLKTSKERVTVLFCCSATGEKLKPLVIGKSRYPRIFKTNNLDVKNLPVMYENNRKGWMTRDIFENYLTYLNSMFRNKNRKILLFLDNAPSHKAEEKYST
jgi:hypothetical protein